MPLALRSASSRRASAMATASTSSCPPCPRPGAHSHIHTCTASTSSCPPCPRHGAQPSVAVQASTVAVQASTLACVHPIHAHMFIDAHIASCALSCRPSSSDPLMHSQAPSAGGAAAADEAGAQHMAPAPHRRPRPHRVPAGQSAPPSVTVLWSAPRGPFALTPRGPSTPAPRGPSIPAPRGPFTLAPRGPSIPTPCPVCRARMERRSRNGWALSASAMSSVPPLSVMAIWYVHLAPHARRAWYTLWPRMCPCFSN